MWGLVFVWADSWTRREPDPETLFTAENSVKQQEKLKWKQSLNNNWLEKD